MGHTTSSSQCQSAGRDRFNVGRYHSPFVAGNLPMAAHRNHVRSRSVARRFMCGWICPVGFLQDVITGIKGRVDSVQTRTHDYWIRLKYVLVGITFLISGTLALALYYGVGSDYQQSLGTDFASGLFIAITPDGTLFGTLPLILAHSW